MNVSEIRLRNFLVHRDTKLILPRTGVLLVSGDNGSGKSLLIEAVATCLWGKTLRGPLPWGEEKTNLEVALDDFIVRRTRQGQKSELSWEGSQSYGTASKAQSDLEAIIGSMDVWQRTSVFSSQDACHFSLASDSERKRLLESVLGLQCFDRAQEAANKESRAATKELASAELAHVEATRKQESLQKQILLLEEMLNQPAPEEPERPLLSKTEIISSIERSAELRSDLSERIIQTRNQLAVLSITKEKLEKDILTRRFALETTGDCPTCGRALATQSAIQTVVDGSKRAAEELLHVRKQEVIISSALQKDSDLFHTEESRATTLAAERSRLDRWDTWQTEKNASVDRARSLEHRRGILRAELATITVPNLDVLQERATTNQLVTDVLGPSGVRAHILDDTLRAIEAVANNWLARIAGSGIALRLNPYKTTASGDTRDAIGMEVLGVGGGRGYRAASGGQRRRIDVALLLALGEVATGASGTSQGTLWCDEVFDSLDQEGCERVAEVLTELSQDRCVVVISHNPLLGELLPDAQKAHVQNGQVQQ